MWYIIPAFGIGLVFPQRRLAEMALFWALWMHYCLLLSFALLCIFGSDTIHRIINRESFPTSNLDTWKGIFLPWDIYVHSPMERNNKHMLIVCPGIQRSLRFSLSNFPGCSLRIYDSFDLGTGWRWLKSPNVTNQFKSS